jgi:hypothetical protein
MTFTHEHIERIFQIHAVQPNDERNNRRICNMLIAMYERQTDGEQSTHTTNVTNGIGFNAIDAQILSSIAEFYNERKFVTQKQMSVVAKKLQRYKRQLLQIANEHAKEQTQ